MRCEFFRNLQSLASALPIPLRLIPTFCDCLGISSLQFLHLIDSGCTPCSHRWTFARDKWRGIYAFRLLCFFRSLPSSACFYIFKSMRMWQPLFVWGWQHCTWLCPIFCLGDIKGLFLFSHMTLADTIIMSNSYLHFLWLIPSSVLRGSYLTYCDVWLHIPHYLKIGRFRSTKMEKSISWTNSSLSYFLSLRTLFALLSLLNTSRVY